LILAHTALAIPFAFVVLLGSVRSLDRRYEQAAASLGANRALILRRVVLPLVRPAVLTSLFLTFVISFDESVVSIFLSGVHVKTLPRRMFEAIALESDPRIGVVATLSMAVAMAGLIASATLRRQGASSWR
jgi:putative spermidine/putrescine transport system permease protein